MDRTPDAFATLPRDEMATLLAHAYAAGFDRAACDAALSRSKPLPEWCRAEVLLHHDMSRQIFTHVPLRDGRSVSATCKTWASTFWLSLSVSAGSGGGREGQLFQFGWFHSPLSPSFQSGPLPFQSPPLPLDLYLPFWS